ncbi:MAG: holliday junction helicase RuvA [Thermacetogenium sp.]|nr:holliday junction helicase RuvA [Thermacetogenium sp.]
MISFLRGCLLGSEENRLLIDVQGIGYEVTVPSSLLQRLPSLGQEVELYTHLYVREDSLQLYGFLSPRDRAMFRILLGARGIGPRVALAILDIIPGDELVAVLTKGEVEVLERIPGVGKKTAQRLFFELRNKLPADLQKKKEQMKGRSPVIDEVTRALLALGYSKKEAESALEKIPDERVNTASCEELLRIALRELGRRKG